MNDLHKAYNVLGLEPGESLQTILRQYKRLVLVWHPDRFPMGKAKQNAEEKLKKINAARDKLKHHFEKGSHRNAGPCACRFTEASSAQGSRDFERAHSGAGDKSEAHRDRQGDGQERSARYRQSEKQDATTSENVAGQHSRVDGLQSIFENGSWRIAFACATLFSILLVILMIAKTFERPLQSVQGFLGSRPNPTAGQALSNRWQHYTDNRKEIASRLFGRDISSSDLARWQPPFRSAEPGADELSKETYRRLEGSKDPDLLKHNQELSLAKLDIDRCENAIRRAKTIIEELETKITNSALSPVARERLIEFRDYQAKCLVDRMTKLDVARQKLDTLAK
jgi:curved DNA-binding protein CbpA